LISSDKVLNVPQCLIMTTAFEHYNCLDKMILNLGMTDQLWKQQGEYLDQKHKDDGRLDTMKSPGRQKQL
jgi:hypothetical protein